MDYTIIRPGGLKNEPGTGQGVLTEDNKVCGAIHREDVADLIVKALFSDKADGKVCHSAHLLGQGASPTPQVSILCYPGESSREQSGSACDFYEMAECRCLRLWTRLSFLDSQNFRRLMSKFLDSIKFQQSKLSAQEIFLANSTL